MLRYVKKVIILGSTHQSHGVKDLLEKDLDGLDALFLLQFIRSHLLNPLSDLLWGKACGCITAQFVEDLLARQAVWRLGQRLVGLTRDMFSQDGGMNSVFPHDCDVITRGENGLA